MEIKPLRLSEVSLRRQQLIRVCQTLGFGQVRDLTVQAADPVLKSAKLLSDERLDKPDEPRSEIGLSDFVLCQEWCRLLARLDQIRDGVIERIEVRAGIPRRVVFEARITAAR